MKITIRGNLNVAKLCQFKLGVKVKKRLDKSKMIDRIGGIWGTKKTPKLLSHHLRVKEKEGKS